MSINGKFIGYVGTYTKIESKGVYSFVLDAKKGEITDIKLAAELDNPTYLTVSNNNKNLYAVAKEGDEGGVTAFSLNDQTGELTKLNSQVSSGSPPCHVSVNKDNSNVVTANYHTTKVESYLTNKDGSVNPETSVVEHEGTGPHNRQEKPHIHFAGFTPDEKYVIAIDLGSDQITTYSVDNGALEKVHIFKTKPGSGPRHMAFHPNGKYAYVMTELSSQVVVLNYHVEDGSFTELQSIPTIPTNFNETNDGSAIHISSDGKFVYAGNRGHNSITIFSVDQNSGQLSFVDWTSTEGNWPRDFVLDPTEKFLIVSNQKSNTLVLFARNELTGRLNLLQSGVKVPEPVCVKFLNQ
ncbi:beta-propeller fold lactonase family protein [Aquibacillus halophilus]|uniref:Beta-propeller fold lactonase family protein n=1 Tax=Aquibacillus halophilus TaxID=930132 RepID=A0A6A8DD98_9BACI|nr:lactonase family protein [Aquibacillus halophilus]MRH41799.1 beta-propeller fold lactonase family protein [Aquibacillus halophilus]